MAQMWLLIYIIIIIRIILVLILMAQTGSWEVVCCPAEWEKKNF